MIPVRTDRLPDVLKVFERPGPALAGKDCPACDQPYAGAIVLVGIGPGDDVADQAKARAGRWHTAAAVAVHALCAGRGPDGLPVPPPDGAPAAADQPEPNAEDDATVDAPDPTPDTEPWCGVMQPNSVPLNCTRRPRHGGQHVAGDGEVVLAVWPA